MDQKKNMTLEELAQEINVSRTTIYKILNNKGKVSDHTREIVLDAIKKYNYVPNLAAKNLALNKKYNIAFVGFDSPRTPYTQSNLLKGVRWAAGEFKDHGLNVELALCPPDSGRDQVQEILRLAEEGIDGFAIYPDKIAPLKECINKLVDRGKLVFTVNKDVPDCRRHAYIGCDYYKSGILAAEVLARMIPPAKEIAVLLGGKGIEHQDVVERYRGLEKKMERFPDIKLRPPFHYDPLKPEALTDFVQKILNSNTNLGGILDLTYELDLVGKIVLKNNNRVRLVGFDLCNTVRNHMIDHSIDAVIFQDMPAQGYLAVKNIFKSLVAEKLVGVPEKSSKLEVVYEGNLEFFI